MPLDALPERAVKLAFALFTFFPHGGLTRDLLAIARACRRRGHSVRVFAREIRGDAGGAGDDLAMQLAPARAFTNHGKNRAFAAALKDAVAAFAPDLLIGFNKMPGLDVYYAADGCFADKAAARGWWYRRTPRCRQFLAFEAAVFSKAANTEILMIAENQTAIFRRFYGTQKARLFPLPPGISRDRIAGDDAAAVRQNFRRQWRLGDADKLLLAIGSGFRTKGVARSITALAALPPPLLERARLIVVGEDNAAPWERRARRLGVGGRVHFAGGRDDIPAFLAGADLLLHPARRENTGTVLLEALVAGLPVIATEVCGYAHYIRAANMGEVLAAPFAQAALNEGAARLLANPQPWRARGRQFAQTADIYDMPEHACRRMEIIAGRRGRGR